jgi:hypothetical protein
MRYYTADAIGMQCGEALSVTEFDRELTRKIIKEIYDVTHVWFEDERGTVLDPVDGPMAVYGPKADAARSN